MASPPVTDDVLRETVDAMAAQGSQVKAASALGISRGCLQQRLLMAERRGLKAPEGYRIKGATTLYRVDGDSREPVLEWVRTTEDQARQEAQLRALVAGLKDDLPKIKKSIRPEVKTASHLLNLIPFGDPHFGLYCWKEEVGNDFDLNIAKQDLCGAVHHLVSQAPPADRCIIANLGDFYHVENLKNETPQHGHPLDVDSRLQKVIRVGVAAIKQAIQTALTRHKVVEVVNSRGNHDPVLSMALSVLLAEVYENEPRVIIHDQPTTRHYIRHGKNLLGFTHGDKTKDSELITIMAVERPEDWGGTTFRVVYRGHHHKDSRVEYTGGIVEQVRTLAPGDAYAVGGGWLSGRDMKLITHHAEYGEVARATCGIDLLRSLQ